MDKVTHDTNRPGRWITSSVAALTTLMTLNIGCETPLGKAGRECTEMEVRAGARCITTGMRPSRPDSTIPDTDGGTIAEDAGLPMAALPLTVDDWFYPSGYMGDGEAGGLHSNLVCESRRVGGRFMPRVCVDARRTRLGRCFLATPRWQLGGYTWF